MLLISHHPFSNTTSTSRLCPERQCSENYFFSWCHRQVPLFPERLQQKKGAPEWLFLGRPRQALQLREQLREGAAAQPLAPQPSCFEGREGGSGGSASAVGGPCAKAHLERLRGRGGGEPNPTLTRNRRLVLCVDSVVVPKPLTEQLFRSSKLPEKVSERRLRQPRSAQAPLSAAPRPWSCFRFPPCRPLPSPAPCKPRPESRGRARARVREGAGGEGQPARSRGEARAPAPALAPSSHPVRPAQP